jgi:DNA-binding SARP family transcriptional activator
MARDTLSRAFEQSSRLDNDHTLVVAGREARDLLKAVRGDGAISSLAMDLIEKIDHFESQIPILRQRLRRLVKAVPIGPPRLTVQTLGDSRVEINGEPLAAQEWTQQRSVRELFFLLLSRPDGLTKEAIGNLLWSESVSSKLSSKFKNSLYRLRRALGSEVVVEEGGRYKFNRWLDYQYDVELFDYRLVQARQSKERSEKLHFYQSALELYAGPYLLDVGGTWVVVERERLRRAFTDGMQAVIHIFLEEGSYRKALEFCERLIAVDPFLEAAYRLSMQAYAGLADRAGIVRQFERCKQNLEKGLGVSPSPQTKDLFRSLTGE